MLGGLSKFSFDEIGTVPFRDADPSRGWVLGIGMEVWLLPPVCEYKYIESDCC